MQVLELEKFQLSQSNLDTSRPCFQFLTFLHIDMLHVLIFASAVCATAVGGNPPDVGMVVNSLDISGPQNSPAEISIKSGTSQYKMGVRADGTFAITDSQEHPFLSIEDGNIFAHTPVLSAGGLSSDRNLVVGGITQWALISSEDFAAGSDGWEGSTVQPCTGSATVAGESTKGLPGKVTSCGGVRMLGGYRAFAGGNAHKTYAALRPHKQVRLTGSFHFIDSWEGETGFVMLGEHIKGKECDEMTYGWTHSYDAREVSSAINVCGGAAPEGRFSVPFDVTIPHRGKEIELIFGSTLKTGVDRQFDKGEGSAWWGVSGVEVYVR